MMVASGASLAVDAPLPLKLSLNLTAERPSGTVGNDPVFFDADRLKTLDDGSIEVEGQVRARSLGKNFEADWARYIPTTDEVFARGNVVLVEGERRLESSDLHLRMSENIGEVNQARFYFTNQSGVSGRGEARKVYIDDREHYRMESTRYTTCPAGNDDWAMRTDNLNLDYVSKVGQARDVTVEYLGVPILYAPGSTSPSTRTARAAS
ncbi:LPS-assembly protein LptD [Parasulfuritortus cantonensis]|nr:LPS-assembly protein LptD [Parasulfuritortus cantonensis]